MISFEKAIRIVKENVHVLAGVEQVSLTDSVNRVLAQDVASDINMPPFRKTAVDGYACRMCDLESTLKVIEVIAAGTTPKEKILEGTCSKIMTGAPIPDGADCVIPVEDTEVLPDGTVRYISKPQPKTNICELGEDIRIGDVSLKKGVLIKPQHIAIMAALGCHSPKVSVRPRVSILPTGDELVEPSEAPTGSKIRNSNGHQLIGQVAAAGALPIYHGIVRDSEETTEKAIAKALDESDVVVLTGGVPMGDYDYVPKIMERLGVKILFDSIAVQPGKPTTFGVADEKLIFGLPGNPVSSFIQFELLVKPALLMMMGATDPYAKVYRLPLAKDYSRKRAERLGFFPIIVNNNGEVEPIEYHGSAHIFSLANASGIASIALGVKEIKKGELVDVRSI
ncbi:molybdopterin molybdotransferase MoeA [Tenuifilum thalassicum]|uniref:Molybdopterin molybdenumtransferase n=1 Tax=Tenuifilum thalassicum TaxID=2590900 RepID=A0A7D3XEN0_9BACT|nr:gephyrin-like molybdotransferase Glp [Tenuifilum thalassicum]QKG80392.1 molybdopterin molybdotransferase MoeA [Tenuifilum thalassicum]